MDATIPQMRKRPARVRRPVVAGLMITCGRSTGLAQRDSRMATWTAFYRDLRDLAFTNVEIISRCDTANERAFRPHWSLVLEGIASPFGLRSTSVA
jgi:hypothetical protein